MPVARSEHAGIARTGPCRRGRSRRRRRPIGATRCCGTRAPTITTPCSTSKGRVWLAATVRGMDNPDFCKKGSDHPSAKVFPLERSSRQVAMLDPKTMKYSFIDTCFGTHHPQFGYDADNTLWLSGTGQVAGWVNTKIWDETGDAQKAQGWSPFVLDINGNGKLDEWTEPGKPAEAGKDMRFNPGLRSLRGDAASDRRLDLVHRRRVRRHGRASCASIRRPSSASSMPCRRKPSACAAATSTATACFGARDRAAIWSASTGASARGRSTGRTRPAIIARKAWRFHRYPGPGFEGFEE